MTLSANDKRLIQVSFSKVEPIAEQAAEIFYAKLFEYDPRLRSLFKSDMTAQGRKLMQMLGTAVNGLDDLESLIEPLQALARRHLSYGVTVDDYTPVGNALLYTLKTGLQSDFDQQTRQAWIKLFTVVATVMREAAYPEYNAATYVNRKVYNN